MTLAMGTSLLRLGWGFELHLLDGLHYEGSVISFFFFGLRVIFVWYWLDGKML
jgi:hypothetical protein